ncbi:MAG: glutamate formimidoyltransferase [Tissierellia bacterium]|nr:glutamate formimidoyltransferase [Tissierellia bacterium]
MKKIIQAIPNFSEGRDLDKIEKIVASVRGIDGVKLVNYSSDKSHNRSVITLLGEAKSVCNALLRLTKIIIETIDMTKHEGQHPRMGALDVCPLVPIFNITMEETIDLARDLGKKIGDMGIPVYLYEYAASKDHRRNLADVRRGGYEGFFDKIKDPLWQPDFGPSTMNEKSGATAVSARDVLIAFNVNLSTPDRDIADKIAKKIRHIGGGLRYVKAMGVYLEEKNIAQVSMNLVNYKKTSIYSVVELIKIEAKRYGVNVIGTELIGAMPMEALLQTAQYYLQIEDITSNQILEYNFLEE